MPNHILMHQKESQNHDIYYSRPTAKVYASVTFRGPRSRDGRDVSEFVGIKTRQIKIAIDALTSMKNEAIPPFVFREAEGLKYGIALSSLLLALVRMVD